MRVATVHAEVTGSPWGMFDPNTSGAGEGALAFAARRHKSLEGGAQCQRRVSAPHVPSIPQYRISCGWIAANHLS